MNEEQMKRAWPQPPKDVLDRIKHILDNFDDQPDDMWLIRATQGIYGPGVTTGLTLGDLYDILNLLSKKAVSGELRQA